MYKEIPRHFHRMTGTSLTMNFLTSQRSLALTSQLCFQVHDLIDNYAMKLPSSQRTSGISNELRKPFVKSFVKRTVKRKLINKFKSKVQHHLYTNVPSLQIQARTQCKKRTRKIYDSNLSLASINNPVTSQSFKRCIILWSN